VRSIGDGAFASCTNLSAVYFSGDAPTAGGSVFSGALATIYYLPGTAGWGATFGGRPTALWFQPNPVILTRNTAFGVRSNGFGFVISWATNSSVVIEACTALQNPVWSALATNSLTAGSYYFSESDWTNFPARFYRVRSL
jgi:hypothetical protein